MIVLGLWDGHDSGAAVFRSGRLLAAVNEERLTRRKLEVRFPSAAIEECLALAKIAPEEVTLVAASTRDVAKTISRWFPAGKERYYAVRRRQVQRSLRNDLVRDIKYWLTELPPIVGTEWLSRVAMRRACEGAGLRCPIRLFDHHECHAAAAAWGSGFDSAVVLTADGLGDGLSATVSVFRDSTIRRIEATPATRSVGILFEHATNLLNMRELEDEGKLMALADYTTAIADGDNEILSLVEARGLVFGTTHSQARVRRMLKSVLWRRPVEQFAAQVQSAVTRRLREWASNALRHVGERRLCVAGGLAANVKALREVRSLPEVDDIFVFPHMGDGGLAVGAGVLGARELGCSISMDLADLQMGRQYSDEEVLSELAKESVEYRKVDDIAREACALLLAGKVVLWFQGGMEYGPRALGGRSILARADQAEIRDRLNLLLKRRSWFQPFCPSILEADARRAFGDFKGRPNRHMTTTYVVREPFRRHLAAVVSIDGTCRPQIVDEDDPRPFTDLLRSMREHTGLGALLNTSFNRHGEPLVMSPAQAAAVFLESGADALAIGSFLAERRAA